MSNKKKITLATYEERYYSREKVYKELQKIVVSHISYIYYAERLLNPYVHYKLGDLIFKTVKIFGVITNFKTFMNYDYVVTVDDGSSEIPCIFPNKELAESKKAKQVLQLKIDNLKKKFETLNMRKNIKDADMSDPIVEETCFNLLIAQKIMKPIEESLGCNLKLNDYVEVIGNIGPNRTHGKAIYIQHITQIPADDQFLKRYKWFLGEAENNFQSLQLISPDD